MGLDMYFTRKTYVKHWDHNGDKNFKISVRREGKAVPAVKPKRISYIEEELMYWRKANAIHGWFVGNCADGKDDCEPVYVELEKLTELRDAIAAVLKNTDNAFEVGLTPQSGFFFGSTEMDDWYIQDLKQTKKFIDRTLKEHEVLKEQGIWPSYYYQASW